MPTVHPSSLPLGATPAPNSLPIGASAAPHLPPQLLQQTPPPEPILPTWFQLHASWLTHTIAGIFIVCAIGLIVLLAVQTTKQEGLSGTIGGRVESAYRGRLGAEEQLKRLTGWVAVGFVATAFILSLTGI